MILNAGYVNRESTHTHLIPITVYMERVHTCGGWVLHNYTTAQHRHALHVSMLHVSRLMIHL